MAKRPEPAKPTTPMPNGMRRQTRGPLGPGTPEVTIHGSFSEGRLAGTPEDATSKTRISTILVTDLADAAERFAHRQLVMVGDAGPRVAMHEADRIARLLPSEERTIVVAGTSPLLEAALDDAWKVVARLEGADAIPPAISEWRTSRTKGSPIITLTRD